MIVGERKVLDQLVDFRVFACTTSFPGSLFFLSPLSEGQVSLILFRKDMTISNQDLSLQEKEGRETLGMRLLCVLQVCLIWNKPEISSS